ncbi:MAG: ADP-ribosylglycohydrolase family protein, partial [Bacteroidaceae bacterium]|nr:ADP-ribosylglycohydrolase family protein [Bacteroidaceae bacterium]
SAANHAGDSDSTAAIAGSYLGVARGYEAIPAYWKTNLQLEEVILHVADDLCRGENTPFHKQ